MVEGTLENVHVHINVPTLVINALILAIIGIMNIFFSPHCFDTKTLFCVNNYHTRFGYYSQISILYNYVGWANNYFAKRTNDDKEIMLSKFWLLKKEKKSQK